MVAGVVGGETGLACRVAIKMRVGTVAGSDNKSETAALSMERAAGLWTEGIAAERPDGSPTGEERLVCSCPIADIPTTRG